MRALPWPTDARSEQANIKHRQEQRQQEYHDGDRRAVTDHAFSEALLVAIELQHVGRIGGATLGHDEDQIEDFERVDGAKEQS